MKTAAEGVREHEDDDFDPSIAKAAAEESAYVAADRSQLSPNLLCACVSYFVDVARTHDLEPRREITASLNLACMARTLHNFPSITNISAFYDIVF
jgi:hypothetical protein